MMKGFTLIEMLLVVALIFILLPMSALLYSNYFGYSASSSASNTLAAELRKAQLYSMTGKNGSGWGVALVNTTTNGGGTIVLYPTNSTYASRTLGYNESTTIAASVQISGFNEVDFSKRTGFPNKTTTVTITGSGRNQKLTVQPQGVVSN